MQVFGISKKIWNYFGAQGFTGAECVVHMHSFRFPLPLHVEVFGQLSIDLQDAQALVFLFLVDGPAQSVEVDATPIPEACVTGLQSPILWEMGEGIACSFPLWENGPGEVL